MGPLGIRLCHKTYTICYPYYAQCAFDCDFISGELLYSVYHTTYILTKYILILMIMLGSDDKECEVSPVKPSDYFHSDEFTRSLFATSISDALCSTGNAKYHELMAKRYSEISESFNKPLKYFFGKYQRAFIAYLTDWLIILIPIAMTAVNEQGTVISQFREIEKAIEHVGPENVIFSIYENGSSDQTSLLLSIFVQRLNSSGAEVFFVSSDEKRPEVVHRIEYLAKVRNSAMQPLYDMAAQGRKDLPDTVVFINDAFLCHTDILELLHQSRKQKADLTCGLDFDMSADNPEFYDIWVTRDIKGNGFSKDANHLVNDEASRSRYLQGLPFQAQCCWNGVGVINANAFYPPKDIRFRRSNITTHECSASECSLFCNDLWQQDLGRVLIVPGVRVTYEQDIFAKLHEHGTVLNANQEANNDFTPDDYFIPFNIQMEQSRQQTQLALGTRYTDPELVKWAKGPEAVVCYGLNALNSRNPDGPMELVKINYPRHSKRHIV